jgi:hypothetical protein
MKKHALIAFAALAVAGGSVLAFAPVQSEKLDAAGVKKTLEGLGYEVEVTDATVDKEQYLIKHEAANFNIPVAVVMSGNKNFVYLIATLGETEKIEAKPDIFKNLLAKNAEIQPAFFYLQGKYLKIAFVMENRGIQAVDMKRGIDLLGDKVGTTSAVWKPE